MFEYFMPLLVMRAYPGTLLDETYRAVAGAADPVRRAARRAMGHLRVGLQRPGSREELPVPRLRRARARAEARTRRRPGGRSVRQHAGGAARRRGRGAAISSASRTLGMGGRYGFYEAIDFTPERTPEGAARGVVLPTYMAHHQGMSLLALDNALHDSPMQRRFHSDPRVQAADLLLQERIPHQVPLKNPPIEMAEHVPSPRTATSAALRRYTTPHTLSPRTQLLVERVVLRDGYRRRRRLQPPPADRADPLARRRHDATPGAVSVTSATSRPAHCGRRRSSRRCASRTNSKCTFAPDRAVFRRLDGEIEIRTEIVVSTEDDAELRRVSVTNHGRRARRLDLTSYAEVVLAPREADLAHPAFSNLFVETWPRARDATR